MLRKIGPAVKRSRSGHYASLRQTWLYRLQAFTGAAPQRGRRSVEAFEASGGTCGYRRIAAVAGAGDRAVRGIMRDEGLVARAAKKKQRYGSYEGEVSEAPPNLLRDEEGKHRFGVDRPNELRITDVTEFRTPPAGCTSRPSWTASTACR